MRDKLSTRNCEWLCRPSVAAGQLRNTILCNESIGHQLKTLQRVFPHAKIMLTQAQIGCQRRGSRCALVPKNQEFMMCLSACLCNRVVTPRQLESVSQDTVGFESPTTLPWIFQEGEATARLTNTVPSNFMANQPVPKFYCNNCAQSSKKTCMGPNFCTKRVLKYTKCHISTNLSSFLEQCLPYSH